MPEEMQIIVKMKEREEKRIGEKIENDKLLLIQNSIEFGEKLDKKRANRKMSSSQAMKFQMAQA
jgi:hypothetical protein